MVAALQSCKDGRSSMLVHFKAMRPQSVSPFLMDKSITDGMEAGCVVGGKYWSLWDQRCAWTGMQDMRSRTAQLKPTNVLQSGDLF